MPIVPEDYSKDQPFLPQTLPSLIDKFDFPASGSMGTTERVYPGTWVTEALDGVIQPAGEVINAMVAWVDYKGDDTAGFPDANRNGQITCFTGKHRGKTLYYTRGGATAIPTAGQMLTVEPCITADTATINTAYGKTIVEDGNGLLRPRTGVLTPVARCLEPPDSNGYLHYVTY